MNDQGELIVELVFSSTQWRRISDLQDLVEKAARAAFETVAGLADRAGNSGAREVVINLSDDRTIAELNRKFRGRDKPTNVLSFPFEDAFGPLLSEPLPLGDIILALETIEREATEQGLDRSHHIAHLVIHGMLHLYGYDHLTDSEAEEMEALEETILARLNIPSPWRAA